MSRKYNSTIETSNQPVIVKIFVVLFFFMLLIVVAIIFPVYSSTYLYASVFVGTIGFASFVWMQVKFNLYARFFVTVCISGLLVLIAWRAFTYLFPHVTLFGIVTIILVVMFSYTLPMWNLTLANFIREELSSPKTKLGKALYGLILLVVPLIGVVSALTSMVLQRRNQLDTFSFIFLLISLFVAAIMPFGSRSPNSPWERDITFKK